MTESPKTEKKRFLTIAISSRALFALEEENQIFEGKGLEAYQKYQIENEKNPPKPGTGFPIVKTILHLNQTTKSVRKSEVIIVSRNNSDTALRIFHGVQKHNLDIVKAAFTSGEPVVKYLKAYDVDLFLSASEEDVQAAIDSRIAAGLVYHTPNDPDTVYDQLRIAFDGDAVVFSEESERIYQEKGLDAFLKHEKRLANKPMLEGPFARLLKTLSYLQNEFPENNNLIRTALVTARNSPAHERVIKTLRAWNVRVDETFFMGDTPKHRILEAFQPHIFFDDSEKHCEGAASVVPTARVPHKTRPGAEE